MEACNVCLDQDDGETCTVWKVKERTARKAHKCYECDDAIPKGARYQFISTLYEERWDTYRTCLACVEVHRALSSCDQEDGPAGYRCLGILWNDIEEYIFPEMTRSCIEKCQTVVAREKLVTRWNKWKFQQ